jgi:hypothetical protein
MCEKHFVKTVTNAVEGRGGDFSLDPKRGCHGAPRGNLFGRAVEVSAQPA